LYSSTVVFSLGRNTGLCQLLKFNLAFHLYQVLYRELRLPLNGDPSLRLPTFKSKNAKLNPSSNKEALIKLKPYHELPAIVIEWRKLNMAISKV
jgi:hypothetical protein